MPAPIYELLNDLSSAGMLDKIQTNKATKKPRSIYITTQMGKEVVLAFRAYYSMRFGKPRTLGDVDGLQSLFTTFPNDDTDRIAYNAALLEWLEKLKSLPLTKLGLLETV